MFFACMIYESHAADHQPTRLNDIVPGLCSAFDNSPCTQLQHAINIKKLSGLELDALLQQPDVDLFKSVQLIMPCGEIEKWLDMGQKPYLGHMYQKRDELRKKYALCPDQNAPRVVINAVNEYLTGNEKCLLTMLSNNNTLSMSHYLQPAFVQTVYARFSDAMRKLNE